MYVVILAGGSGTRFWPLSRKQTPKQLMSVFGGKSMLQRTVERVLPLRPKRVLVVTNRLQAPETARQLVEYQGQCHVDIIAEPAGRNTAPAIGLAAMIIASHDPDGVMLVLPADHFIVQEDEFRRCVAAAGTAAADRRLVTMGLIPSRPETGYGYIEADKGDGRAGPYPVKRFVEKPDLPRALEFLEKGTFYWNSGMFLWRADVILDNLLAFMPDLSQALSRLTFSEDVWALEDLKPQIEEIYRSIGSESIDFGVMEKADNVVVMPAQFGWSDVGSWSALPEVLLPDGAGNVAIGGGEAVSLDASNCLLHAGGKLAALVGVTDLIVVNTPDALLVCHRDRAQDVKRVVEQLEKRGLTEYL